MAVRKRSTMKSAQVLKACMLKILLLKMVVESVLTAKSSVRRWPCTDCLLGLR